MMSTVLEPSLYTKARLPLEQAESLPRWCYTTQEFYDEEVSRIFRKTWNFVGREDEIPSPGDFLTVDLFGEFDHPCPRPGRKVHAFANTCRHRGTRLLSGSGRCPAIRCPYHSWTYGLSGELISTPGMEGVVGFNKTDYGLIPVRRESWGGFMFVTLDPDCVPLTRAPRQCSRDFLALSFREHDMHAPKGVRSRVQLEALCRERDGGLSHRDCPSRIDRKAGLHAVSRQPATGMRSTCRPRRHARFCREKPPLSHILRR